MEGGRPLVPFLFLVDLALASAAFGSVAKALFSCSSRARRKAVDWASVRKEFNCPPHVHLPHLILHPAVLVPRSSLAPPSRLEHCYSKRKTPRYHSLSV